MCKMAVEEKDIVSNRVSVFFVKAENAHYNGLRLKKGAIHFSSTALGSAAFHTRKPLSLAFFCASFWSRDRNNISLSSYYVKPF